MVKRSSKYTKKAGLPPGTLIHVGKKLSDQVSISLFDYDANSCEEHSFNKIEDAFKILDTNNPSWLNVNGLHDVKLFEKLGKRYGLHNLMLEDILNVHHRPKTEDFGDHIFITLKMLGISESGKSIVIEQVSIVLGEKWVFSFQEKEGDLFDDIRERIQDPDSLLRKKGADYLFYRIIDIIVDNYFYVTEHISESIENLEEEVLQDPSNNTRIKIQQLKKKILQTRKLIVPLREAISILSRVDENPLINPSTNKYMRDVYEHIIQVNDSIETQRDLLSGLLDLYLSGISNRMNQIMQTLTIMATIFIPLTFIAGIYGMNFEYMPELGWKYGYFVVWGIMLVVLIGMLFYFRKKKWL